MGAASRPNREPHVAVCVDKSRSYGRGVLQGIADFVENVGPWSMFVDHYASSELTAEWTRRWKGDGILAYVAEAATARRLIRSPIPVVDVAGHVRLDELPRVIADDEAIGGLAAEHLRERLFRNFAFVGPGDTLVHELRHAGFVRGLEGAACHDYTHPRGSRSLTAWERQQERLARWLEELPRPIGVMAYSDVQARDVLDACMRAELLVPTEVAVVGVDNDEELCRLSRIPISSVASNPRRIGFEAAMMISRMMKPEMAGGTDHPIHVSIPPMYVVARHSSDVTVVDDVHVRKALAYIHRHAGDSINVDSVARAIGVPRRSLYRRFSEALDRTPHEELKRARFDRARRMLAETDLSMSEVAHLSGFDSAAYLCTSFKAEYGLTPGDFRESYRNHS